MCREFCSACMQFRAQFFVCLWWVCWERVLLEEFLVFGGLVVHLSVRRLCGVCGCFDGELLREISRNCTEFWGLVLVLRL